MKRDDKLIGFQPTKRDEYPETEPPSPGIGWESDRWALIEELSRRLTNLEGALELKVDQGRIVSQLLLTKDAALLTADKIAILGEVTFLDYWRDISGTATPGVLDPSITQIRGGVIRTERVTNWEFDSYINLDSCRVHKDWHGNILNDYNSSKTYVPGEHCHINGTRYNNISSSQGIQPGVTGGWELYWEIDDVFLRSQDSIKVRCGGSFTFGGDDNWVAFDQSTGLMGISGELLVGEFGSGTGMGVGPYGLFLYSNMNAVHAFSLINNAPLSPGGGSTIDALDCIIGNYFEVGGQGIFWDNSTGTLNLKGNIDVEGEVTANALSVTKDNMSITINENGMLAYQGDSLRFGFTMTNVSDPNYPGGVWPAGTAYFSGHIWASEIRGEGGLTIRPDIHSDLRVVFNDTGIRAYDTNNDLKFAFTLVDIPADGGLWPGGTLPAGSAGFSGDISASRIVGNNGLTIHPDWQSDAMILLNQSGMFAYDSGNTLRFGYTLTDTADSNYPGGVWPAGTAYFSGHIWASEIRGTDGLTVRPTIHGHERIELKPSGLHGYDSEGNLVFLLALQDHGIEYPAGSAYFRGTILAGSFVHSDDVYIGTGGDSTTLSWWLENDAPIQEGSSMLLLVDRVLDYIEDGTEYKRVKAGQINADGLIYMDALADGTYKRVRGTALDNHGLVLLDQTIDGTYGKILTGDIQAGHIKLSSVIHDDTNRFVSTTYISAGKITLSEDVENVAGVSATTVKNNAQTGANHAGTTHAPSNATNGAHWGTNLFTIPVRFTNTATTGLNLTVNHMGYYDGSNWRTYMDSWGRFQFYGNSAQYINWDGSTLNVRGSIVVQNPATVRADINVGNGADKTSWNTAYNISGAGTLSSGSALTVDGDMRVTSGGDITFLLSGGLTAGAIRSSSSGMRFTGSQLRFSNRNIVFDGLTCALDVATAAITRFSGGVYIGSTGNRQVLRYVVDGVTYALPAWIAPT